MRPVLVEKDTRDQLAVAAEARSISTEKPFRNSAKHTETFYNARWLVFFPFNCFMWRYGAQGWKTSDVKRRRSTLLWFDEHSSILSSIRVS